MASSLTIGCSPLGESMGRRSATAGDAGLCLVWSAPSPTFPEPGRELSCDSSFVRRILDDSWEIRVNHSQIVSFLWGVADLIRDTFKRGKYQDVILPLTVLRRLDCVLAPTKAKVLETQAKYKGKLENLDPQLRRASGFA